MECYSTKNKSLRVHIKEAILQGLAPDGSLYMPEQIPLLPPEFFDQLQDKSLVEIARQVISPYFIDHIPQNVLNDIITDAFDFPVPVIKFSENLFIGELFHGPTFAFKDFGARFLSRILSYYQSLENQEILILVATSGDTGGAVASGFYGLKGINVGILYPSGGVSPLQEKQLTTWGGNIVAYEVQGSFDDCQRLVKTALMDQELREKFKFSSANSINLARLIPQSLYYFECIKQIGRSNDVVFIVPSGNLGNLFAGVLAKAMGLNYRYLIAACNANDTFTNFINQGVFKPKATIKTLSNAMDVGNPSNFERINDFFGSTWNQILLNNINSISINDEVTLNAIKSFSDNHSYILDPHGAVGYASYELLSTKDEVYCILETAHPAKFDYVYKKYLDMEVPVPKSFNEYLSKEKKSIPIKPELFHLKNSLLKL